jgi:glucose-6-phosphate 1-epimerase
MTQPAPVLGDFHGLPALHLEAGDGGRATVLLHGAHLVSWVTPDGREQLYLSPRSVLDGREAVRGGVPVIFPQFSQRGPLPRHGFARVSPWQPVSLERGRDDALAVLRLEDDARGRTVWPQRFVCELTVRIAGPRLDLELSVEHPLRDEALLWTDPAPAPMRYTAALHTYLRVDDVEASSLEGLQRLRYIDQVRDTQQLDMAPALRPAGNLDRIYFDAARPLTLRDGARRVEIAASGFPDVVVWNPGAERGDALADMPPGGWREMLCVEAAVIGVPVELAPGEHWVGRQSITVLPAEPGAA